MAAGRPLKYDAETFLQTVAGYFATRGQIGAPTKAGLLLYLGISRETWREYKERPEFVDTIKEAELKIEDAWNQQLLGPGATGPIFYLKNAFKEEYRDKQEVDHTTQGKAITGFNFIPNGGTDTDNPANP